MNSTRASVNQAIRETPDMNARLGKKRKRTPGGSAFEANHITGRMRRQSNTTGEPALVPGFTDLGQEGVEGVADSPDAGQLAVAFSSDVRLDVGLGEDAAAETHLCGLADAEVGLRNPADFAGQAHFAKHGRGR